jgi:hypothetical protein
MVVQRIRPISAEPPRHQKESPAHGAAHKQVQPTRPRRGAGVAGCRPVGIAVLARSAALRAGGRGGGSGERCGRFMPLIGETVACLRKLLAQAERGEVIGVAYGMATLEGD